MKLIVSCSELVQTVIEAEKAGICFYERLSEVMRSTKARDLFARIGEEEQQHVCELERLSHAADGYHPTQMCAGVSPEEYSAYLRALLEGRLFTDERTCRQMARNTWDEAAAAQLACTFEKEIILFLYEVRRFVPEAEKLAVDRLLEAGYTHLRLLHALGESQRP